MNSAAGFANAVMKARRDKWKGVDVQYLTPAQVVKRWDNTITTGTLANWRSKKTGPAFLKIGSRVVYPIAKLEEWEAKRLQIANDNEPRE